MIPTDIQTLHALWWAPATQMHSAWWSFLDLGNWQTLYAARAELRPEIDRLVRSKLTLQGDCPSLSARASKLFADRTRLLSVATSTGLVLLNCSSYLLLNKYKKNLQSYLSAQQLNQLSMVFPFHQQIPPTLTPEQLPDTAMNIGLSQLSSLDDPSLELTRLYIPPDETYEFHGSSIEKILNKIERFL